MLCHLGALVPGERPSQFFGQSDDGPRDRIAHRLGAVSRKRWSVLYARAVTMTFEARQVQQHREARRALDQRAITELPRPRMRSPSQCPGTARSSASAGRWHDVGRYEALAA